MDADATFEALARAKRALQWARRVSGGPGTDLLMACLRAAARCCGRAIGGDATDVAIGERAIETDENGQGTLSSLPQIEPVITSEEHKDNIACQGEEFRRQLAKEACEFSLLVLTEMENCLDGAVPRLAYNMCLYSVAGSMGGKMENAGPDPSARTPNDSDIKIDGNTGGNVVAMIGDVYQRMRARGIAPNAATLETIAWVKRRLAVSGSDVS